MKENKRQLQEQIEIEVVVLEEMQECLRDSLEWLEVYIEKTGCYLDWQQRKQLPKTIERENVRFMDATEVKGFFSTVLFSLSNFAKTSGVPFALERLQTQFYSWLDKSGINIDNCPKELAECLVNIDNVLNGKGEEFRKVRREEVRRNISQMTPEEQERKFYGAIVDLKKNLKDEEAEKAWLEAAKNKNPQDVRMENKFAGNAEQGKVIFEQIESKYVLQEKQQSRNLNYDPSEEFLSSSFQATNSGDTSLGNHPTNPNEVVREVKNKPQDWTIDEIPTEINSFGRTKKKEVVIYCGHAQLNDYNQQGKLNFINNPIHRWESFNSRQRFEIKQVKNISGDYLTIDEIKWVFREFKNDLSIWEIKKIDGQIYLVHNSAQIQNNEIGTLIHSKQKFSEIEWAEINGSLEKVNDIKQNAKLEKELFVLNRETGEVSENEDWFIHNSLKREIDDKTGYLVYVPNAMIRAKDLSEGEQKAVGYLEQIQQTQTSQSHPSGSKGGFGSPYVWGSLSIISLIGLAFTAR